MPDTRTEHMPINLLLADVRQALFDAAKSDPSAGSSLRYEAGRAVGLMGRAMDEISAAQASLPAASEGEQSSDLECAAQLERSGLITREKYNHICENIKARDRMREAMA